MPAHAQELKILPENVSHSHSQYFKGPKTIEDALRQEGEGIQIQPPSGVSSKDATSGADDTLTSNHSFQAAIVLHRVYPAHAVHAAP